MTDATNTTRGSLTQEEILALSLRARADGSAFDEFTTAFVMSNERLARAERRNESLERQVEHLEHRLALVLHKMFGRSSEKIDPAQLRLFLEAMPASTDEAAEDEAASEPVSFMRRPKGHRRSAWPAHVPREEIRLEPDAKDRKCHKCGKDRCRIREDITERGEYFPGYWKVRRYIRGIYACCGSVVMADLPQTLVDKSRLEPSAAVSAAVAKFGDHIPLERQSEMHARLGVEIAPTTLGDNVAALADLHRATVAQAESEVLSEKHIHVDDTPVGVLIDAPKQEEGVKQPSEPQKKKIRKLARVWAYVSLTGKVFYRFTEDRSRDMKGGPAEVLGNFRGTLIGDEYAGYDKISRRPGMTQAGCWVHCRRKFKDALGEDKKRASIFILMIGGLFHLESAVRKRNESGKKTAVDAPRLLTLRRRWSKKRVERIFAYAKSIEHDVLPKSGLGIAIGYLLNNRAHLEAFLADPLVPPDNNAAERALRGIAVGRKNYLHFGSMAGGDTAAVLYSLIGSCKALGINPYAYLLDTTTTLLKNPDARRAELTPWAWAAAQAKRVVTTASPPASAADPP